MPAMSERDQDSDAANDPIHASVHADRNSERAIERLQPHASDIAQAKDFGPDSAAPSESEVPATDMMLKGKGLLGAL